MSVPVLPAVHTPSVMVDWGNSGTFSHPAADVTRDTAADPGLVIDIGRDGARALNPPKVPAVTFELRNDHVRYSNENPISPTYGQVRPGTPLVLSSVIGARRLYRSATAYRAPVPYRGLATWPLAVARLDEATQQTAWGQQRVRISGLGASSTLVGRTFSLPLMIGVRTDVVVSAILDAVGWPADKRFIAIGDTLLSYWWADERSAWDALIELVGAEGAGCTLYEDASGVLHFEDRGYRSVVARSVNSQAIFADRSFASGDLRYRSPARYRADRRYRGQSASLYFTDLSYTPGWRNVYTSATYATKRRQLGAPGTVVWQNGADITLSAGEVRTIFARPQDPFQNAIAPVAGTDYVVSGGSVTVAMTYTSGFLAILQLTAGGSGATITGPAASPGTGLQLRAQPLTVISEQIARSTIDTSAAVAAYGAAQNLDIQGWPEIEPVAARAVCDSWVVRYQTERPQVTLTVVGGDHEHMMQIIQRDVSDRITVRERNTGLDTDVWIESREITISGAGGRHVAAVWGCEKVTELAGFVWDGPTTYWGAFDDPAANHPPAATWAN